MHLQVQPAFPSNNETNCACTIQQLESEPHMRLKLLQLKVVRHCDNAQPWPACAMVTPRCTQAGSMPISYSAV